MTKYAIAISTLSLMITVCPAQDSETGSADEPIMIQPITSPVKLDGLSNDAAWKGIESFPMTMRLPDFGREPSERTDFLLGYDDDYLYPHCRSLFRRYLFIIKIINLQKRILGDMLLLFFDYNNQVNLKKKKMRLNSSGLPCLIVA